MKRLVTLCLALALPSPSARRRRRPSSAARRTRVPCRAQSVMVLSSNGGVCSAVVLAPDVVLTAAHCVTGADRAPGAFSRRGRRAGADRARREGGASGLRREGHREAHSAPSISRWCAFPEPLPAPFRARDAERREGRRGHARHGRRLRPFPRGRCEDHRHLPHGVPDGDRALRPEPDPALARRIGRGERLPGRFRRADGLRSGGRGDHELVVAGQGPQLRRPDAGHSRRRAARLDRPRPRRLAPCGVAGAEQLRRWTSCRWPPQNMGSELS